jgi:uncharacterized protein YggE
VHNGKRKNNLKINQMKKLLICALLSISTIGFAQKNFIDQHYIEVTGKAELEVLPDRIYVRIMLRDKDNKDKLSLQEIEKRMISSLSELGIDVNKDLALRDFASNLQTYFIKTSTVQLTKYYQLTIRDAKTLQNVFLEFQRLGISSVSVEKTEHSQIEQYRKDVRVSAVKAAREKAESLAIALNQSLGNAIYVQETPELNENRRSNVVVRGLASTTIYGSRVPDNMEADIEFEKIKVESTFLVRFELK